MIQRFLIAFVSVFLLSQCSGVKEIQCSGVKGFKLDKIDMSGIEGDIQLTIKNDNAFKFIIYPSSFDVTYGGIFLGKAFLAKKVKINGKSENVYDFHVKKEFKDISLSDIMKLLNGAALKNAIEVKGDLKVGRFYLKRKIQVDVKERLRLD